MRRVSRRTSTARTRFTCCHPPGKAIRGMHCRSPRDGGGRWCSARWRTTNCTRNAWKARASRSAIAVRALVLAFDAVEGSFDARRDVLDVGADAGGHERRHRRLALAVRQHPKAETEMAVGRDFAVRPDSDDRANIH